MLLSLSSRAALVVLTLVGAAAAASTLTDPQTEWVKRQCDSAAAASPAARPLAGACYDCYVHTQDAGCFSALKSSKNTDIITDALKGIAMYGLRGADVVELCEQPSSSLCEFQACLTCLLDSQTQSTWGCKHCIDNGGGDYLKKSGPCMRDCVQQGQEGWACGDCLKFGTTAGINKCIQCLIKSPVNNNYKCLNPQA